MRLFDAMEKTIVIEGEYTLKNMIDGESSLLNMIDAECGIFQKVIDVDVYEGETTITPSNQVQILNTKEKMIPENMIIQAIPSNYGKITWNGFSLTVE